MYLKSSKKVWIKIIIILAALLIIIGIALYLSHNTTEKDKKAYDDISDIEITLEDLALYRERIGTDMDIKKAILILFETEEQCIDFINEHGNDENPLDAGQGIIPIMENGYYNIVGKKSIEEAFDALSDGEYSTVPVCYSNLYCYLKRVGVYSPVNDDEELKKLIQNEKYMESMKKQ